MMSRESPAGGAAAPRGGDPRAGGVEPFRPPRPLLLTARGLVVVLAVGLLPTAAAYAAGPSVHGLGWFAPAIAVFAALLATAWVDATYRRPLVRMVAGVRSMQASEPRLVSESGIPVVQALARAVNHAGATIHRRQRLSQANLLSVEEAFDRVHSVLQALGEAVILVDSEGILMLANPGARALLARDGSGVEGRDLMDVLPEDLRQPVASCLLRLQQPERDDVRLTAQPAGDRYYDLSVARVRGQPGRASGTVVSIADVTRNHEIARLKDEFLSSMSHELRTPLTNICAFTELLAQVTPDSEKDWREFLNIVTAESERLTGLLDDILEHSRLQTDQLEWDLEGVDMGALTSAVGDAFRSRAEDQDKQLDIVMNGQDLVVYADRAKVHSVLARLLDNALKFTPEGGVIRASVTQLDGMVEMSVADSGGGIPSEHRETVFERFRQIGDPMTEKPRGTGLGLPICRGLIDGMHGTMWCEESEFGGANMRFVLPAAAAVASTSGVHASPIGRSSSAGTPAEDADPGDERCPEADDVEVVDLADELGAPPAPSANDDAVDQPLR